MYALQSNLNILAMMFLKSLLVVEFWFRYTFYFLQGFCLVMVVFCFGRFYYFLGLFFA